MYSINKSAIVKIWILMVCALLITGGYSYADGTAGVRVINTSAGDVTIVVRDKDGTVSDDGIIRWTGPAAEVGGWRVADQYIEISHTGLPPLWGIQIYTDNKNGTPAFVGAGNPAGLVRTDTTSIAIPMAWRITDKPPGEYDSTDPDYDPEADPYNQANAIERDDHLGMTNYLWHFIKDKNTPDDPETLLRDETFVDGYDYITVWNQKGIAWNEGGRAGNPTKTYLYLAARFTTVVVGVSASTTTLTLEAYHGVSPFPIYVYKDAPLTEYPELDEEGATLENHYAYAFMNHNDNGTPKFPGDDNIIIDDKYPSDREDDHHCLEIKWNGGPGEDGWRWAGAMWLEPEPFDIDSDGDVDWVSGPEYGYDLRGATHLSFWVRTGNLISPTSANIFFGLAPTLDGEGNPIPDQAGDSCLRTPPYDVWTPLETEWKYHFIPTFLSPTEDMSHVSGGFGIVFNDQRSGYTGFNSANRPDFSFGIDLTGDGRDEIITWQGTNYWALDLTTGRVTDSGTTEGMSAAFPGFNEANGPDIEFAIDVNGDGRDEVVIWQGTNYWIRDYTTNTNIDSGTSEGMVDTYPGFNPASGPDLSFAIDVNGDGRDEAVIWQGTNYWARNLVTHTTSSGTTEGLSAAFPGFDEANGPDIEFAIDVNGDGRDEAVIWQGTNYWIRDYTTHTNIDSGTTEGMSAAFPGFDEANGPDLEFAVDVNGDGRDESVIWQGTNYWVVDLTISATVDSGTSETMAGAGGCTVYLDDIKFETGL